MITKPLFLSIYTSDIYNLYISPHHHHLPSILVIIIKIHHLQAIDLIHPPLSDRRRRKKNIHLSQPTHQNPNPNPNPHHQNLTLDSVRINHPQFVFFSIKSLRETFSIIPISTTNSPILPPLLSPTHTHTHTHTI